MDACDALVKEFPSGAQRVVWHEPRAITPVIGLTVAGIARETSAAYDHHGLKRTDPHRATFQYTLSGEGRLRYEGREYRVQKDQAMLLHFPHDHRYWLQGGSWHFLWLAFSGESLRLWQQLVGIGGPVLTLRRDCPAVRAAATLCARALRGELQNTYQSAAEAFAFVMELAHAVVPEKSKRVHHGAPKDFVQEVELFCLRNIHRPIGVDDMAKVAKMSRYHFTRRFQSIVGVPPGKYLTSLRLDEARRMLNQHKLSVKQIAQRCGFSDTRYFSRLFRLRYGSLPSRLRAD